MTPLPAWSYLPRERMQNPTEQQVKDWIAARVLADNDECVKIVLRHLTMEGRHQGDVLDVPVLVDEGLPVKDAESLARQVVDAAQADADSIGGSVQMYALYAYYKKKPECPRKVFRISPESELDRDVTPSEPPTEKGVASQLMRHLEAVQRISVQSQGYLFGMMERQLQRLQDKDERNGQQQVDMILLVQEILDGGHSRRLTERKEEAVISMREDAMGYLKVAAPIILNRLAGKPVFPEKNKSFMLLASLLENLRPEQQALLRDGLDPAQMSVLAEILGEYEKDKAAFEGNTQPNERPPQSPDLVPSEVVPRPPRLFQSTRDRIQAGDDELSRDPVIRRLEQIGSDFASRMSTKDEKKNK